MDTIVTAGPPKPSRVFLGLWQQITILDPELPADDFLLYAETWRRIREMEEAQASAKLQETLQKLVAGPITPAAEVKPVTYDCASAPIPDAAAAKSEAGKQSLVTRKRKLLETLEDLRARGVSLAEISAASSGLTLNDVLDALDRKPLPLPKLAALEKAAGKLNKEADAGGGEDS